MSGAATAIVVGGASAAAGIGAATALGVAGTAVAAGAAAGMMKNTYDQGKAAQRAGEAQLAQQKSAQAQNVAAAEAQAAQSQQATNRANQQTPDTASIVGEAQMAAKGGASGTMLTGPMGVDPNKLSLGKNTLLGG
jgi:hypothetical protein